MPNENVLQLPQATQPLTGLEVIYAVQNDVDTQTTTAAIAALSSGGGGGGGGGSPGTIGQQDLSIKNASFAATVAKAPLIKNYQFGSAAVPAPGVTTITSLTDLAANFNPFEDFTALTSINSEIQRYQPFNSVNHVFNPNSLTLQGVNPNNDWNCTIPPTQLTGAGFTSGVAAPIAVLGLATTAGLQVGQMVGAQGGGGQGGTYWITGIVADTSVTLNSVGGAPSPCLSTGLLFWLPVVGLSLSQPFNSGGSTFTFASVPAFVTNQMAFGVNGSPTSQTLNRSADWRVTSVVGNQVNFAPAYVGLPNLSAGQIIWFLPVVTSGQIWSQLQINLCNPQTFYAIQADLTLFNSVTTRTAVALNGELNLAQFAAIPTTTPQGAWPAFWSFQAEDGTSGSETGGSSEIDMMEIQYGCTQDITYLNSGAVTYPGAATMFAKSDSGWQYQSAFQIFISPSGTTFSGRNLFQFILTNGMEYRFFNGILYKARQFRWINQRPMQFAVDLSVGGLTAPLVANTIFPNNSAGFANMQTAINSIKVWYLPAPGGA